MPDDQISPLDAINRKFGLGAPPGPPATAPAPAAEPGGELSPLDSINQKFGLKSPGPAAAQEVKPREDFTDKYNTPLPPEKETKFQEWAKDRKNAAGGLVANDLADYDVRGRWQQLEAMSPEERAKAEAPGAHGPDTWEKPSHITFSKESKYHGVDGHEGGTWGKEGEQDTFTPGASNLKLHGPEDLQKYFTEREPGIKLQTPGPRPVPFSPAPTAPGEESTASKAAKNIPAFTRGALEPIVGGIEMFAKGFENLLSIPERVISGRGVKEEGSFRGLSNLIRGAGDAFLKGSQLGLPMPGKGDELITMPGQIAGTIAGFVTPMRLAGGGGVTFLQKLATNALTFGLVDASRATAQGHEPEQALEAAKGSIPSAVLFSIAQSLPFGKIVSNPYLVRQLEGLATGTAFAGGSLVAGDRDPVSLAVQFGVGYGIHMFGTRGQPQQELMRRWIDNFKKTYDLSDTEFKEVVDVFNGKVKEDPNAPAPDPAAAEQVKQNLQVIAKKYGVPEDFEATAKTPQPETFTPEQQKQAVVEGPLGKIIEGTENRNDAVRQMMAEHGMEGKQAERFYDLYEKGDAETALKEFPEFSSFATEAQKRAAVVPAEGAEIPEPASGPMPAAGSATERAAPPAEPGTSPETEEYIRLRKMANKVQLAGDPAAAARLNELIKANPEIANLFKPEDNADWSRLEPILTRMSDLMKRIEKDGDPKAAQELTDYIKANPEALKGFPRWPVEVPPGATEMVSKGLPSVAPAGRSNEVPEALPKEAPPAAPRVAPAPPEPPSFAPAQAGGAGNVGLSPTPSEGPKKRGALIAPKPAMPDQPMGTGVERGGAPTEAAPDPLQAAKGFKTKFGSRQGPPDVGIEKEPTPVWLPKTTRRFLPKGQKVDIQKAIDRGDNAALLHTLGGVDPRTYQDYISTPEEAQALGRLIGKKGGLPLDVMIGEAKAHFPDQFGHFENADDMVRYFLDRRHDRALNQGSIEKQIEGYHADIEEEAKRRNVSQEELEKIETDGEREIAAERAAIQGEGGPGGYDLEAGWPGTEEGALRAGAPKADRITARLDAIASEYPDLDREKAATVLRALPDAENGQIAAMSADPEMFSQVARGNLAASEKAQLLKKATDAGAQQGLPGMGKPEGETLFKATEEPAPTIPYEEPVTFETAKREMGKAGFLVKEAHVGDASGYHITLPSGKMIFVITGKDFAKPSLEEVKSAYPEMTQEKLDKGVIAGEWQPMSLGGIAYLAKEAGVRTFRHEVGIHAAADLALTAREMKAILKEHGDWETAARAYEDYSPWKGPENPIFRKIWEFFNNLMHLIRPTGESTFEKIASGEVWLRKEAGPGSRAVEKGRPIPFSPAKAKMEWESAPAFEKQALAKALHRGELTLEDYNARYAEKYGEWDSAKWAKSFPDLAASGVKMVREDGTVATERKFRVAEGGEWDMEGGLAGRVKGDAKAAREEGRAAKNWLMSLFASNRTSKEALKTHQIIAGSQAESATEKLRMQNVFMKYVDGMGPIKGDATQEFLRLYESGQEAQITHPIFKAFAEEFRAEERRHMEIMTMLGDAPKEIPFYIDHLWKENEAREALKAQLNAQVSGGRSMRGPDYYKLLRTVVDIPSGIAQGLEPRFDTLPEMVLAGRSARENRIAATKRLTFIKENGYEKVVRDVDGGTYTVADAQGKEQEFKSINDARRFATDNPGSSDPRFEPDVPQGWIAYPGGYGEVWAKIKRPGGAMIPGVADEETMPLGGGPERAGYVEVPKVNAWSRVGYRVGPEDVVRQFEDFLGRGLSGNTAFELYQSGLHAVRHSQMALSFFHAFFESINAVSTHAGGGIFDSLGGLFTGDWRRMGAGLKTLATSPLAPFTDIRLGLDINKTLMKNGVGIPGEATDNQLLKDARTLVGGGMRPEAESKLAAILSRHFKEAFKLKGDLALGKRGYELLQGLSSPTMEVIVPFSKQGSTMFQYLNEVKRWERENPGKAPTQEDLRNIAYECRQTADYIYGRMAKDNVAMNDTVKSLLTGVLQFPTWQFGTVGAGVRSMIGAKDVMGKVFDMMQGREIRKLDIKDRQALQYVTGLLFTVGMTGALMTYAFTGKPPETMADYFFPKTGEVNPNGSEERLQLPSYFKDAMGVAHHPFKTIGAKLASPIHILTDLIQNKDYWGTQIYDPHDWIGQRGIDVLKYMAKTTAPFAIQSYEQGAKGGPGRFGMSLLGVRPVPRETANTPAQNVIDEYNQLMRASTTTKESAEKKKLTSDLMKMARDQDEAGFKEATDAAVSEGKMTRQQVKELVAESQAPPSMGRFIRLPLEWATRVWDKASDYEKEQWQPYFLKKVMAEKPENLIKNREAVVDALTDMGLTEAADAVTNLTMPEETGVDLTGLGLLKPAPEMSGMDAVDAAIAAGLETKLEGKVKKSGLMLPRPGTREKKKPYGILGL